MSRSTTPPAHDVDVVDLPFMLSDRIVSEVPNYRLVDKMMGKSFQCENRRCELYGRITEILCETVVRGVLHPVTYSPTQQQRTTATCATMNGGTQHDCSIDWVPGRPIFLTCF